MKQLLLGFAMLVLILAGSQAGDVQYSTSFEKNGHDVIEVEYAPIEYAAKPPADASGYYKAGSIETGADVQIGDIKLTPGEYTFGFKGTDEKNYNFVVWVGEEVKETALKVQEHGMEIGQLTINLTPSGENSSLFMAFGKYFALLPVVAGEASGHKEGDGDKAKCDDKAEGDHANHEHKGDVEKAACDEKAKAAKPDAGAGKVEAAPVAPTGQEAAAKEAPAKEKAPATEEVDDWSDIATDSFSGK